MTDRIPLDHLTSDDLDQLYEQLDRAQRVAMRALDDEPTPSRRSGLRDEIAAALEAADYRMDMQRGDLADSVMPVLYREWPWLRAEAEHAATGPRILCAHTRPGSHTTICDLPAGHGDHDGATGYGERVTWPADWTPPPPGDHREQLPDEILAHIRRNLTDYTSTACGLDRALVETMVDNPDTVAELKPWRDRMHNRCRLNHKFTGQQCGCWCHETEEQPGA